MRAVAEAEVAIGDAVEIETVGIGELALVAVGGAEQEQHLLAVRDGDPVQGNRARGRATQASHRRLQAQELFDRLRDLSRLNGKAVGDLRVRRQQRHAVADEIRRRLDTADDDVEAEAEDLRGGQVSAVDVGGDECADQVVRRPSAPALDEVVEIGVQLTHRAMVLRVKVAPLVPATTAPAQW